MNWELIENELRINFKKLKVNWKWIMNEFKHNYKLTKSELKLKLN